MKTEIEGRISKVWRAIKWGFAALVMLLVLAPLGVLFPALGATNPASLLGLGTVATLQSGNYQFYPFIYLVGYSGIGKGAGFVFYDSSDTTSATDHCRIFVDAAGHRFKRPNTPPLAVTDCGAQGNGTSDDTISFGYFFTYLSANGGSGFMPVGTYKTTATITIPANVSVHGEDWNKTIIKPSAAVSVAAIDCVCSSAVISDFYVDGVNTNGVIGIRVSNVPLAAELTMNNVQSWNFTGTGGKGMQIVNQVRADFHHLYLAQNTENLDIGSVSASSFPDSLSFYDSVFHGAVGTGVAIKAGFQIAFWNCTSEANGQAGYAIKALAGGLVNQVYLYGGWLEANWQSVAVGSARHAEYHVVVDGTAGGGAVVNNIGIQDTYFNGSATEASGIRLTKVTNIRLHGPVVQILADAIVIENSSSGWLYDIAGYPTNVSISGSVIADFVAGVACSGSPTAGFTTNAAGVVTAC